MPESPIYLDHAATTPLNPRVREAMLPYGTDVFGNPSSLHRLGREARKALDGARVKIAKALGALPEEIIFTSGGTEANNLAILGLAQTFAQTGQRHLITSAIEHPSVLGPCNFLEQQGWQVSYLPVNSEGQISLESLQQALRPETAFVSLMHGNNEIGTLQPLDELGTFLRQQGIPLHTDAVQTIGKLPLILETLPVDYLSFSGHKLYGPKGIGALYIRKGALAPSPMLLGGGQENQQRSGTENLAAIVGLALALELCVSELETERPRLQALQKNLMEGILQQIPEAVLNGPQDLKQRVPGNVNFSFPPLQGESLVLQMDLKGIAVSSGSACHSARLEPSHVVLALGKSPAVAQSTLRFSLGRSTSITEIERVLDVLPQLIRRLSPSSVSLPS